jgi:hypothetical protein
LCVIILFKNLYAGFNLNKIQATKRVNLNCTH